MPTFRHGKNTVVYANATDLTTFFNSAGVTSEVETAETTTFGASAKAYIVGLKDGTASLEGFWDGTVDAVDPILVASLGVETGVLLTVGQEGSAFGSRATLLNSDVTSYDTSSPVGDVVSISASFQADGGVDSGIILQNSALGSTTNGTAVDNTASSANGSVSHLHVTANDRDVSSTIKVQHSVDNSTWVDLITFSVVATSVTTSQRVETTGTVNRYLRAQTTLSAGTGSITVTVTTARR